MTMDFEGGIELSVKLQQRDSEYLYAIQNIPCYFYTGHTRENHQVLLHGWWPELVMVVFDADGNYLKTVVRESFVSKVYLHASRWRIQFNELDVCPEDVELEAWQNEVCTTIDTIRVKKFFLEDYRIGIADYPDHFEDMLESPEDYDEDPEEVQEQIHTWYEGGEFVLWWSRDIWMDSEGDVTST